MWQIGYPVTKLVSRHRGTLSVVLLCPHYGAESPPNVPERAGQGLLANCHLAENPESSHACDHDGHRAALTGHLRRNSLRHGRRVPQIHRCQPHRCQRRIELRLRGFGGQAVLRRVPPDAEFVDEIRAESGKLGGLRRFFDADSANGNRVIMSLCIWE